MKINDIIVENVSSPTLQAKHQAGEETDREYKAKGFRGVGDRVIAKAFGPNESYPAPWTSRRVDKMGIYAVFADNGEQVATWLNQSDAEQITDEVNGMHEGGNAVGAQGIQATMKDKPDSYLKHGKLVGG